MTYIPNTASVLSYTKVIKTRPVLISCQLPDLLGWFTLIRSYRMTA